MQGRGRPHARQADPEGSRLGKLLSPARRRVCVEHVQRHLAVSERRVCVALGQHRSTQMARSLLLEAAWFYRLPAKVGQTCWGKQHGMDQWLKDVAWRAQLRLTARYRRLVLRGKRSQVAITAVARELVGFVWSIATHVGAPVPA